MRRVSPGPSPRLHVSRAVTKSTSLFVWIAFVVFGIATSQAYGATATSTSLALTSGGAAVTTFTAGSVVTLTATVKAGSTPVNPGQVSLCDSTAVSCTDIHLIATLQLNGAGVATFKFIPGIGIHSYQAVFAGTGAYGGSASSASSLTVTGSVTGANPSVATLSQTGSAGNYSLTATVTGNNGTPTPTGPVSFRDIDNGGYVLGTASLGVNSTSYSLTKAASYPTTATASSIVTADFDGDGLPDIAATIPDPAGSSVPGSIAILLSRGGSTFATMPSVTAGGSPTALLTADFNGDGIPDLACGSIEGKVTVLLGNGDGTFKAGATVASGLGMGIYGLVAGDFNGDGNADLVGVTTSTQTLFILLGHGDGTFTQTTQPYLAAVNPAPLATGDFNRDGKLDIVISNGLQNSVTFMFGNGDGTFTAGSTFSVGPGPENIIVADFNGDGNVDLAVTNIGSNYYISILLGHGDGSFTTINSPPAFGTPFSTALGDFNGDGKPDIAVFLARYGGGTLSQNVYVLLGNGDGTFAEVTGSDPASPVFGVVADFTGDGRSDIAVTDAGSSLTLMVGQWFGSSVATVNQISPVGTGTHRVNATYGGDSYYAAPAITPVTSLTALPRTTTLTMTSSPASSNVGQAVVLTATLNPDLAQTHDATGAVTFSSNGTNVATGSVLNGVATASVSTLAIGTDSLKATYLGDTNFATSTSPVVFQQVVQPRLVQLVGSTSAAQTAQLTFAGGGTIGALSVLTQGKANLEFNFATGGTCSVGAVYTSGQTCTVNFTLTPARPGARYGGIVATDNAGTAIATTYIQGTGTGAQVNFLPGTQSQLSIPNMVAPYPMTADSLGNLYIAKAVSAGSPLNAVVKETLSGNSYVESTVATGFAYPVGVAVDGAGNVYVADQDSSRVYKETPITGGYVQTASFGGLGNVEAVAVDGSGNVYIGSLISGLVKETFTGGIYTQTTIGPSAAPGTGLHPFVIVADGDGNVYFTQNDGNLFKETLSGGTYTQSVIASGVGGLGLAIDANGNLFTQQPFTASLYKVSPSAGGYTQTFMASIPSDINGIAADGSGNVYMASSSGNGIWKQDYADPPTLSFNSTTVGSTSSDSPRTATMFNAGNASLSFQVPASGPNPTISAGFTIGAASTCPQLSAGSTSAVLAANATCTDVISFQPTYGGPDIGRLTTTDDNLNIAGSTQIVPLNGNGIGLSLPPTVTGVSPSSGTSAGGTVVQITGTNLFGTQVVSFGTVGTSSFIVNSATSITASTPPGSGTVDVTVLNPAGTSPTSPADLYTYVDPIAQTIHVTPPPTPAYAGTSTLLTATGGASGNPVVFSVVSGPASVSGANGSTLTYIGAGTVTLSATQAGSATYSAAAPVQFTVVSSTLTEPVASTTSPVTTLVTFATTGTLGSINAFTQGKANLDFGLPNGGGCTIGTTYLAGQTCTVTFNFTPTHPGLRYGALSFTTSAGVVLANSYVYGMGTGPQVIWNPGTQTALGSGLVFPSGAAVDGNGNVYASDINGNQVVEIPAGGGPSRVLGVFTLPDDVAVDGSGNVFVTSNRDTLSEILAVNGVIPASPTIITISTAFASINGMKVDGNGNIYIASSSTTGTNSAISEVFAVNGSIPINPQIKILIANEGGPTGVAVDASGNLFVSDELGNRVYKVPAVNGVIPATPTVINLANVGIPTNIALDSAGNLFVANAGTGKLTELFAVNGTVPAYGPTVDLGQGMSVPQGLAVDANGNVYVADGGLSSIVKLDYADPPSLSFASTFVGSTSTDSPKTVTLINDGNANLTIPPPISGRNPSITDGFTIGSSSTCPQLGTASTAVTLASNASCTDVVSFTPLTVGTNSGFLVTTDDALNHTGATQAVPLNGIGLVLTPTTTTLTVSPNPAPYSKPITFTAVVSPSASLPQPLSGTVTFAIDGSTVPAVTLANSTATFVIATLPVGTHTITCTYSGDARYATSTCNAVVLTVMPQDFTLTANPPSISIQIEHHATMPLTLTSIGSWTGPVSLACGTSLPAWLTCELPTSTIGLAPNATVQVNFTMDTDAILGFKASVAPHARRSPLSTFGSAAFAALLPLTLLGLGRRRKSLRSLLLLSLFLSVLTVLNGCSGKYPDHTAPGTYTIPVIATGTNAGSSTPTTHTLNITLTVTP